MTLRHAKRTSGGPIGEYMGRNLDASADMADAETVRCHYDAVRLYVDGLAARVPCNTRIGDWDLWNVVSHVASRILPFASGIHEFTEECHRIRSFVGQALTHPAYEMTGSSRMGDFAIEYATMPGMLRVSISDGEKKTGFGFTLDEDGVRS